MRKFLPVCLLTLCCFLFLFRLGERDLYSSHEGRAAQNAQVVLSDGGWGLPRLFDRRVELQKPPLYYWLVALFGWCRGGQVDAWAVRLPAALSALGCVLFVFFLGWRRGRPVAGLIAAAMLATFVHFTWLARVGRIDMLLTLAVTVALGSFWLGRAEGSGRWYLLGYVAVALGILAKGPVAAVLVGVVALVHGIFCGGSKWKLPRLHPSLAWGVPLVVGLAAPWFLWANHETDGRLWEVFFLYHNVERGLGSEVLASHPWWFYGPRLFANLMPWSLLLPIAVWRLRKHDLDAEATWGLVWCVSIAAFLSLMSFKRNDYLLPAYPGAALILGYAAEDCWRRYAGQRRRLGVAFLGTLALCAIGWAVQFRMERSQAGPSYRELAQHIREQTQVPVIFFRAEAHALAFHVGRPLDTILEWENLAWWANRDEPVYIVMPQDCADGWREHLPSGHLDEVERLAGNESRSERPLVVMRARGRTRS